MTPKEKAKELLNRYIEILKAIGLMTSPLNKNSKRCALIAVDEIWRQLEHQRVFEEYDYWQEVRQELEKL